MELEIKQNASVASLTRRRVACRLLPFLLLLYVVAFLDRVNIAYAGLEMSRDLGFSDRVFGFGAGIFFISYLLFAIPGTLLIERGSARRWISILLLSWGLVTMLLSLVRTPLQFYVFRFLLGTAEAGFFPGIIVYLAHWFSARDRAKAVAGFMIGIPIASIVGSPLAGLILRFNWHVLSGWRWLFILEGVPAIVLAAVTLFYLTDRPIQANWLTSAEKGWLTTELEREAKTRSSRDRASILPLHDWRVISLGAVYLFGDIGLYGFTIWFPTILKRASGYSILTVTSVAVLPYLAALCADVGVGWHSDKTGERYWHTALPLFFGAAVLVGLTFSPRVGIQIALFTLLAACLHCWQPCFWTIPTTLLGESAAAASVGFINAVGHVGAFSGPFLIGYLRTTYNSFAPGLMALLASLTFAGILVLSLRPRKPDASVRYMAQEHVHAITGGRL